MSTKLFDELSKTVEEYVDARDKRTALELSKPVAPTQPELLESQDEYNALAEQRAAYQMSKDKFSTDWMYAVHAESVLQSKIAEILIDAGLNATWVKVTVKGIPCGIRVDGSMYGIKLVMWAEAIERVSEEQYQLMNIIENLIEQNE